eukprot:13182049-Heterocapsa_arctica.AAC.1
MEIVFFVEKRMQESIIFGGNRHSDYGYLKLTQIRHKEHNQPECFWNAGVVTTDWTTLPVSEHIMADDICHECKGTAKK